MNRYRRGNGITRADGGPGGRGGSERPRGAEKVEPGEQRAIEPWQLAPDRAEELPLELAAAAAGHVEANLAPEDLDVDALGPRVLLDEVHPDAAALTQLAVELAGEHPEGRHSLPFDPGGEGHPAAVEHGEGHVPAQPLSPPRLDHPGGPLAGEGGVAPEAPAVAVVREPEVPLARGHRAAAAEPFERGRGRLLRLVVQLEDGVAEEVADERAREQVERDPDEHDDERDGEDADEEVGEGELAPHPPEEAAEQVDPDPQQHQQARRRRGEHGEAADSTQVRTRGGRQQQAYGAEQQDVALAHEEGCGAGGRHLTLCHHYASGCSMVAEARAAAALASAAWALA